MTVQICNILKISSNSKRLTKLKKRWRPNAAASLLPSFPFTEGRRPSFWGAGRLVPGLGLEVELDVGLKADHVPGAALLREVSTTRGELNPGAYQ